MLTRPRCTAPPALLRQTQKVPVVPPLPPSLVLDLGQGTATSSFQATMAGDTIKDLKTPTMSKAPSAAALVAANANASFALAGKEKPRPIGAQRIKALEAIANARLDVAQVLGLTRMCSEQIRRRGLETMGLFRSLRVAQSQEQLDHLVQLFLLSVNPSAYASVFTVLPENALERLSQRPEEASDKAKTALLELDKELRYASVHDVVALLKWGLRHTRTRTSDFDSTDAYGWYDAFVAAERDGGYQLRAIAELLLPKLPNDTAELLGEILELMATVSAHQPVNHMPASHICSILGFWLFGRIGVAHPPPTFEEFHEAWQKSTRIAEHLLLAHIRSQASVTFSMPLRLTELVEGYPVIKADYSTPGFAPAFAQRHIHTLRVDLKSENLVVSPGRPRVPSNILASALDASASASLEGGRGETWAAVIAQIDSSAVEGGKGQELLIPEHARILRLVDEEVDARRKLQDEATNDLRRYQPLATLNEDTNAAGTGQSRPPPAPPSAPVPVRAGSRDNGSEVSRESNDAPRAERLSLDWRSFSEGGFGSGSPTNNLALADFAPKSVDSHSSRTLPSRRSTSRRPNLAGGSLGRRRSSRMGIPSFQAAEVPLIRPPPPPNFVVTSVSMMTMDTSLTTLWQDSLLDNSLCSTLPPFVLVQLEEKVAASADLLGGYARDERPWLLIAETVLPPRPPTPVERPIRLRGKGSKSGDDQSMSDGRSIFAPSIMSIKSHLKRRLSMISNKKSGTFRRGAHGDDGDRENGDASSATATPTMLGGWA
ncbi:hypothetical protein ACQY0O_001980 [Thecaphora frezii]